ncbi:MAG: MMPL family transporter [Alphaproteobacteria bacterium]|jgi:hopanoid biosynthesis associated RND transporter like protein HpnN|nr:MMPL family transporter [Alphaproteobacteria bacterium]
MTPSTETETAPSGRKRFAGFAVRVVEGSRRSAWLLVAVWVLLSIGLAVFTADRLRMDTDVDKLIADDLPWRERKAAFEEAFPEQVDSLVMVIEAPTPDLGRDAARRLAEALDANDTLFRDVRVPGAEPFFRRHGLLFLPLEEVAAVTEQLVRAQPFLAALAQDPTARGLVDALGLALGGVALGEAELVDLDEPLALMAETLYGVLAGEPARMPWRALFTGQRPGPEEQFQFVITRPRLDHTGLQAGREARAFARETAQALGLTAENGFTVRQTGSVALKDEELATVAEGAGLSGLVSVTLVVALLFLAVRSFRLIVPVLVTLAVGLILTAAFAAATVGTLNPISVAFSVMFVGIGVDFGIQFTVRYRHVRHLVDELNEALRRTARRLTGPLLLAAASTSVGFLSFVPTDYVGVSQLGLIAGAGMLFAVLLNLTLLPALLTLCAPPGEDEPVGYRWTAGIDRFLLARRWSVMGVGLALAIAAMVLLPQLRFDFNPFNLRNQQAESVATANDLMADNRATPFTINVLTESPAAAADLAAELRELPEVSRVLSVNSFVPANQEAKLALIDDAAFLLGPSLAPDPEAAPPSIAALRQAFGDLDAMLEAADPPAGSSAAALATVLDGVLEADDETVRQAATALAEGLPDRLLDLRLALEAGAVSLDTLPDGFRRRWVSADGRARVEVFPAGDVRDNETLVDFAEAVRAVAPDATGPAITLQESGDTVVAAFREAGLYALAAIAILLLSILRRVRDTLLVMAPLVLAGLYTLAICVLTGLAINFANIIALPLLLGIGVAYNIYFVMNWRAGVCCPLQSSTARAIVFSALTTASAFGSLALSTHPGTATMGLLLTLAIVCTLAATLILLPAMLGDPPDVPQE